MPTVMDCTEHQHRLYIHVEERETKEEVANQTLKQINSSYSVLSRDLLTCLMKYVVFCNLPICTKKSVEKEVC